MALESLPSRWHSQSVFSSRPFRPLCPGDGCSIDGRTLLNRKNSESSDRPRPLARQHSFRASGDRGVPPGSNSLRGERGLNGLSPSPSSIGSHQRSSGTGRKVLQRWKSDGAMVLPRAVQFEEYGGEESWRKPTTEPSFPDLSYRGFQRFDSNNTVSSSREHGVFSETGVIHFESQFGMDNIDRDRTVSNSEASAVNVTAPSFVRNRSFAETAYSVPRVVQTAAAESVNNTSEAVTSTCRTRPSTLKRRLTKSMSLDKAQGKGGLDRPGASTRVPQGLGGISSEYVALPDSLRKLKKRNKNVMSAVGENACCSIKKAFDSMVFMIRALQNCAFEMREIFVSTKDVQSVLGIVQREMQSSFVWLFQQVFSCTPTLMVSVMILLANFTVFSLGNNVANASVIDPPAPLVSILRARVDNGVPVKGVDGKSMFSFVRVNTMNDGVSSLPTVSSTTAGESTSRGGFGSGGSGGRSVMIAGGEDGDYLSRFRFQRNAMFSDKVSESKDLQRASGESKSVSTTGRSNTMFFPGYDDITESISGRVRTEGVMVEQQQGAGEQMSYQSLMEQTIRELDLKAGVPHQHVVLDQETVRRLVAPVTVRLEPDSYTCFDRTDLEYQHAVRDEPTNTMLLVNYAQFLFAIRRDHRGAEHYFSKALQLDKEDGDIWARWAIFLWLGRNNKSAADEAYQTALALDPYNPYHASSYAHFLWHTDDD
ncbi:hypothetical protein R1sor_011065 [Riccia sorocarpa]|uniref:Uncharacterized protein n=1 Tax=Riccia sorocarpa TaxID=122646 RepID=A0ABD3I398_9MARC